MAELDVEGETGIYQVDRHEQRHQRYRMRELSMLTITNRMVFLEKRGKLLRLGGGFQDTGAQVDHLKSLHSFVPMGEWHTTGGLAITM